MEGLGIVFPCVSVLVRPCRKTNGQIYLKGEIKVKTTVQVRETYKSVKDYEKNCYLVSPSISKRRSVRGKSYYVRRYFRGGQDFEKAIKRLALKHIDKNAG